VLKGKMTSSSGSQRAISEHRTLVIPRIVFSSGFFLRFFLFLDNLLFFHKGLLFSFFTT
jgi:hypothetical protein